MRYQRETTLVNRFEKSGRCCVKQFGYPDLDKSRRSLKKQQWMSYVGDMLNYYLG